MTNKKRTKLLAAALFVAVLISALPATMLASGELGEASSPEVLAQPNENYPDIIPIQKNIVDISHESKHGLAIDDEGALWGWGGNATGQLGLGYSGSPVVLTAVGLPGAAAEVRTQAEHSGVLLEDGTVYRWGNSVVDPALINIPGEVIDFQMGESSALALTSDGRIWGWGTNLAGELGLGHTNRVETPAAISALSGVDSIYMNYRMAHAIKGDKVYSWGQNANNQLQIPGASISELNRYPTPRLSSLTNLSSINIGVSMMQGAYYAFDNDGQLWRWGGIQWGIGGGGVYVPVAYTFDEGDIVQATGSRYTSYLLLDDGSVWVAGINYGGMLGVGDDDSTREESDYIKIEGLPEISKLAVGMYTVYAQTRTGDWWCWGQNGDYCLLPNSEEYAAVTSPVLVFASDSYDPTPTDPEPVGDYNVTLIVHYTDGAHEDETTVYPVAAGSEFYEGYTVRPGYEYRKFSIFSFFYQVNSSEQTVYISEVNQDITVQIDYDRITHNVVVTTQYEDGAQADEVETYQVNDGEAFDTTFTILDGYKVEYVEANMLGVSVDGVDKTIEIRSVTGDVYITIVLKKK